MLDQQLGAIKPVGDNDRVPLQNQIVAFFHRCLPLVSLKTVALIFKSNKISTDAEICQQLMSSLVRMPMQKLNNRKVLSFVLNLLESAVSTFNKSCKTETTRGTQLNLVYILAIRRTLMTSSNAQKLGRVCTGRLPLVQALSLETSSPRNGTIGYDLGFVCTTCTKTQDKKQVLVCLSCAQRCHVGHFMLPLGFEPEFLCHCNLLTDHCICSGDQQSDLESQDFAVWTGSFRQQLEAAQSVQ